MAHAEGDPAPAPAEPAPVAAEPTAPPSPALTPSPAPAPAPSVTPAAPAGTVVRKNSDSKVPSGKQRAFRGSTLSYSHTATAYSFSRNAQNFYDPTWSHSLGIAPEWHFNDHLFARARLNLSQEFTTSNRTTQRYEVELSDLSLDVAAGWTEPFTRIRIGGDFRVGFPTSKASRFATRLLAIGPGLNVSRTFPLRAGLIVGYSGRYSYRFHRYTTPQNESLPLLGCADRTPECLAYSFGSRRNAHSDVTHGPSISFAPFESLSFAFAAQFTQQWLYRLPPAEVSAGNPDVPFRYFTTFDLSVTWQLFKPIGITIGASTLSLQLNSEGVRQFPLFNRDTTLYLDASFDLEAAAAGLFGEPT